MSETTQHAHTHKLAAEKLPPAPTATPFFSSWLSANITGIFGWSLGIQRAHCSAHFLLFSPVWHCRLVPGLAHFSGSASAVPHPLPCLGHPLPATLLMALKGRLHIFLLRRARLLHSIPVGLPVLLVPIPGQKGKHALTCHRSPCNKKTFNRGCTNCALDCVVAKRSTPQNRVYTS